MRPPIVIDIPDPSLVVLVGAAGAGKSTFAARWFEPAEILSSDAFRERLTGDPANQRITRTAFSVLHRALERRLLRGQLTAVDATNVEVHARRALTRRAATARVPAVAIVLALPPSLVLARNATRPGRTVPSEVVRAQLDALDRGLARDGFAGDGFTRVELILDGATLEAVRLERRPRSASL